MKMFYHFRKIVYVQYVSLNKFFNYPAKNFFLIFKIFIFWKLNLFKYRNFFKMSQMFLEKHISFYTTNTIFTF